MSNAYTNSDVVVRQSYLCVHDSNVAFTTDFSRNGDVDGWLYYDGIHTYGCWNDFIFATLYGDFAVIGRDHPFQPFSAEDYFIVTISMELNVIDRAAGQNLPSKGKLMWRTLADPHWDEKKSTLFEIYPDSKWHTYTISVAEAQYWQGDVYDLRVYPIYQDGRDGDEFFIRSIQVKSIDKFNCDKPNCEYFRTGNYSHPCQGVGLRGKCISGYNNKTMFTVSGTNDSDLLVNIDGYGFEHVLLGEFINYTGHEVARLVERSLSLISLGGYEAAEVNFTEDNRFEIISGTNRAASSVLVDFSPAAVELGFYDASGNALFTTTSGTDPADLSEFLSSYRLGTYGIQRLFDANDSTSINFDPHLYNVEAGRKDWDTCGTGGSQDELFFTMDPDYRQQSYPNYNMLDGFGKVIIDYCHPFNATGRIKEIHALGTPDIGYQSVRTDLYGGWLISEESDAGRITAKGSKFLIFRPQIDGSLVCVETIPIEDKTDPIHTLYDRYQMSIDVDCDIFVNKGDLLGIYNIKLYKGPQGDAVHTNALYYEFPEEVFVGDRIYPGSIHGDGVDGLLLYARSSEKQTRLRLDVDLNHRINISDLIVTGSSKPLSLEYNLMRCVDINWNVDVFGLNHTTAYYDILQGLWHFFTVPNIAYGVNRLNDGIYKVQGGKAADSWASYADTGVIPNNPYYFWVNGDHEWIGRHYFEYPWFTNERVIDFESDPVAFYTRFPLNRNKKIFKSKIYFKEENNFKNFALSYYVDDYYISGNADNPHYNLIPEYTAVTLDNTRYEKGSDRYDAVKDYLFSNPTIGKPQLEYVSGPGWYIPGDSTLPGHPTYNAEFNITNNMAAHQAIALDWKLLQHEWEPLEAKGFRIYTDFHYSTKVLEMELYGFAPNLGSTFVGGLFINYSLYKDYWIPLELSELDNETAQAMVGDTPRYFTIEFNPITAIKLRDILLNINEDDLYVENPKCKDLVVLGTNGIGRQGQINEVVFKNIYGKPYDLYVDVLKSVENVNSLSFYDKFDGYQSLSRAEKGPAPVVSKSPSYPIRNDNKNIAINCDCFTLDNSIIGKLAYYSYDNGEYWFEFNYGKKIETDYMHFSNIPNGAYSIINIPVISRNRYWRLAFKCKYNSWNIREIKPYYKDEELTGAVFYHNKNMDVFNSSAINTAPHLNDHSTSGSYYTVKDEQYITIDLGSPKSIDKLVVYHDFKPDWVEMIDDADNPAIDRYCGVDRYTTFYLLEDKVTNRFFDYSYYENTVNTHGVVPIESKFTSISGSYLLDLGSWSSVSEWEAREYENQSYYSLQHLTYFNWVSSSGTVTSGTYEYPGYLDFSIEGSDYDNVHTGIVRKVDEEKEFYWGGTRLDTTNNPEIELKVCLEVTDYQNGRVEFGFIDVDRYRGYYYSTPGMLGCCVRLSSNSTKIVIINPNDVGCSSKSNNLGVCALNTKYYFKLVYDGYENYSLKVWTDDFDGSALAFEGSLVSSCIWGSVSLGLASSYNHTPPNNYVKGKLYHFEVSSALSYNTNILPESNGTAYFDGSSYLSAPKQEEYRIDNRLMTIDFWMCPTSLPKGVYDVSSEGHKVISYKVDMVPPEEGYVGWGYKFVDSDAYIIVKNKRLFDLRTEDFTFDCYFKFISITSKVTFFYRKNTLHFYYDAINHKLVFESGNNTIDCTWLNPDSSVTYHLAVSRAGSNLHLFIDGDEKNTTVISGSLGYYEEFSVVGGSNYFNDQDLNIGCALYNNTVNDQCFGIIEEARFTKGFARWSSSFTPPAGKFIPDEYTKFLIRGDRDYSVLIQQRKTDVGISDIENQYAIIIKRQHRDPYKFTLELIYNDTVIGNGSYTESYIKPHRWTNIIMNKGYRIEYDHGSYVGIGGFNNKMINTTSVINITGLNDIEIGKYFSGYITNVRISRTDLNNQKDKGRYHRRIYYSGPRVEHRYGRLYTISFYASNDNAIYGHYCDVDLIYPSQYSYYIAGSLYSKQYFSMLAIDLEKRYSLEFIRNFGASGVTDLSLTTNTIYSSKETDDVNKAFEYINETDIDTTFSAQDYSLPKWWTVNTTDYSSVYIFDNRLLFKVNGETQHQDNASAEFKYVFNNDFDAWFEYEIKDFTSLPWSFVFTVRDVLNDSLFFEFNIGIFYGVLGYKLTINDNSSTSKELYSNNSSIPIKANIRIKRVGDVFSFYYRENVGDVWAELSTYKLVYNNCTKMVCSFALNSNDPGYPAIGVFVNKFEITQCAAYYSDSKNARWVMLTLLNGDGVSRLVERLNVFTEISTQLAPSGGYNNSWTAIGPATTLYSLGNNNIALGIASSSIESSPTFGPMSTSFLTDGDHTFDLLKCWGVNGDIPAPYFIIDFGKVYDIYKVVLYHGAQESPDPASDLPAHMMVDYTIEVAENEGQYITFFDVSGNTEYERTHEVTTPVKARWLRLTVNAIEPGQTLLATSATDLEVFNGVTLREIEVYEYYGFSILNSDDTPIVAINMKSQFYTFDLPEVVGPWKEDLSMDWVSVEDNYSFSDSVLSDPEKITFTGWGKAPNYEQWVVTKNLDATNHLSGKRYLKHLKVIGWYKENPVDYYYWWSSKYSNLSNSYDSTYYYCTRSLVIDYPKSNLEETVKFIEGDDFGVDEKCSWRDALKFRWYIEDYSAVDWTYGKFVFGGYDGTSSRSPIYYEWYFTTISGQVSTGWNDMFLRFKSADNVNYDLEYGSRDKDPRAVQYIDFSFIETHFKGNNTKPIKFEIDGFSIARNMFEDYLHDAVPGLYLSENDNISIKLSNLSLSSGAISMWLRPDTTLDGVDSFGEMHPRNIFSMTSTEGDSLGCALSEGGFLIYYGNPSTNSFKKVSLIITNSDIISVDSPWHFAMSFSNDGTALSPRGTTIRIYLNGVPIFDLKDTWEYMDDKFFTLIIGGTGSSNAFMNEPNPKSISAVIGEVKVFGYAKEDFYKDLFDFSGNIIQPLVESDLIEISKDNVTFYKVDSSELPFVFKQVPAGGEISIFVRSDLTADKNLISRVRTRTAPLLAQWDIGV